MPQTTAHDLTGRRFGRLVALHRSPGRTPKRAYWLCRCDCGQQAVKMAKYLRNGDTQSCGCEQRDMRAAGNPRQGNACNLRPREYTIWRSMKSRCYVRSSSNYRFYGAKGVRVCDRWRNDFRAFIADMGPCPANYTIDRINPHGDYEPSNCRWESWAVQHRNIRKRHAASRSASSSS